MVCCNFYYIFLVMTEKRTLIEATELPYSSVDYVLEKIFLLLIKFYLWTFIMQLIVNFMI